MYRLLLIVGLLIILYFLLRSTIREFLSNKGQGTEVLGKDDMVQDPVCRTYVPRGSAVSARIGGQTYFFCSQDCAHTFRQQLSS
jgi:YHS domain-containing protein